MFKETDISDENVKHIALWSYFFIIIEEHITFCMLHDCIHPNL